MHLSKFCLLGVFFFAMLLTGVPLIFVAIGLGVQLDQYGTDE